MKKTNQKTARPRVARTTTFQAKPEWREFFAQAKAVGVTATELINLALEAHGPALRVKVDDATRAKLAEVQALARQVETRTRKRTNAKGTETDRGDG